MFSIKGLSHADLEIIKKNLVKRNLARNEVLYESSRPAHSMFFLESGSIKIIERTAVDGSDDQIQKVVKPGGYCGEEALLSEVPIYFSTAVSLEESEIFILSKESLQKIMANSMNAGTKILLSISKDYRQAIISTDQTAKTIVFYSPKDGSGRTTIAANTAALFAKSGKKVLLFDADFQFGNLHILLGLTQNPNIARLVTMEPLLTYDRIKHYLLHSSGVDLLACPHLPQESEIIGRQTVTQILQEVSRKYDYIIIDSKSSLDEQTLLFWDRADTLVLVAKTDFTSLTSIMSLFKVFSRLDYHSDKFYMLLNRFEPTGTEYLSEFSKIAPYDTATICNDFKTTSKYEVKGIPFAVDNPLLPISQDITKFANNLMGVKHQGIEKDGGIFSKIKSFFG
ncbi:MAG: AAA family ATPase [Candidatus Riflebacteria bacterium]|nr:AAA family ATPase [Candidatus Riflebacteria bacterium]